MENINSELLTELASAQTRDEVLLAELKFAVLDTARQGS